MAIEQDRPLAVYALEQAHMRYGAERMALATLEGLAAYYRPLLLAPPGVAHETAAARGIASRRATGPAVFAREFRRLLAAERELVFLTTSVEQSLIAAGLNVLYRRRLAHLHVAHGGPDPEAYRRKPLLNRIRCRLVAVSEHVRRRLIECGARPAKITVIDNFLEPERAAELAAIEHPPERRIRRVLTINRLEPLKRPHLILDAIDLRPELHDVEFRMVGDGELLDELRERARGYGNVSLPGFSADVAAELARADLLLHACPIEAFGLVVLEAMTAGVPVLVPDRGGAGDLVEDGYTGYRFRTDDAADLADHLVALLGTPSDELDRIASAARRDAVRRYGMEQSAGQYRALIEDAMGRTAYAPLRQPPAPGDRRG